MTEDTPKAASAMNLDELRAYAAEQDSRVRMEAEDRDRAARGLPPRRQGPRWSEDDLAATQARVAAAEERRKTGPQLPPHLAGKNAQDMSPREHAEASRILGLPELQWSEVEAQQAAWERRHGRG